MQLLANEMLILVNSLKVETHNLKLKAATPLMIHKFNL